MRVTFIWSIKMSTISLTRFQSVGRGAHCLTNHLRMIVIFVAVVNVTTAIVERCRVAWRGCVQIATIYLKAIFVF
jgi:hypothetical protein